MSAIVAEQVSKRFGAEAQPAVDECSFRVATGEFVVLLGPSGCGKTTLLKLVNRLYEPTSGRILINGTDTRQVSVVELRRQIGYVIQQTGLFPHMRIADNIAVVPRLLKWDTARINNRIDELLALVGLPTEYRQRYPRQLSGGEQQRVGIARALAADPPLVLMDEPFSAIDAITRLRLQDELLMIQRRVRKTILFVTHDVEEALRLADRIVVMRKGRIVQFDTPLAILTRPADEDVRQLVSADDVLRRLSLMRVETLLTPGRAPIEELPSIEAEADLRSALTLLLASAAPALAVVRDGRSVGVLSLDQIRAAASDELPEAALAPRLPVTEA